MKACLFSVRKEDWEEFLNMMEDSADNFSTWEDWKVSLDQTMVELFSQKIDAVEVVADLEDFKNWCRRNDLPRNGASRSRYAAEMLRNEGTPTQE